MELRGDGAHLQALVGPLAPEPVRDILARMVAAA
jgi:hypothetical protein